MVLTIKMSNSPEFDLNLDQLFLPAWAQKPSSEKNYENYKGREEDVEGGRGKRDRFRSKDRRPNRASGSGRGDRPSGGGRPPRRDGRDGRDGRDARRGGGNDNRRRRQPERRQPLPELKVAIVPVEDGVRSLAKQIKKTCRAYPLFEIATMILKRPERFDISFDVMTDDKGNVKAPLYVCSLDGSVWLSENELTEHVLKNFFDNFYQTDRTPADPPKGVYTFVAQCGMSGIILGPPNYHDYQRTLHRVHSEKFPRMDFETYKSRVKIVRDEEVVKQWVDERSWKTDYTCLNVPEPLKLDSREEVEEHFKKTHLPTLVSSVQHVSVHANEENNLGSSALKAWVRRVREEQRRFPIRVVNALSQQFARQGLQFFKVNKTVTHVSVARPRFLDVNVTPVSNLVKRIVEYIDQNKNCTPAQLVSDLTPEVEATMGTAAAAASPVAAPATTEVQSSDPAPVAVNESASVSDNVSVPTDSAPADTDISAVAPETTENTETGTENLSSNSDASTSEEPQATAEVQPVENAASEAAADTSDSQSQSEASDSAAPASEEDHTPAQAAILSDLRWLLVQGHVIEFANGALENAKPSAATNKPKKQKNNNNSNAEDKEKSTPAESSDSTPAEAQSATEEPAASDSTPEPVSEEKAETPSDASEG